MLKDVDPDFITKFVPTTSSLSLDCFLVTPNCHRVTEVMYAFNNGQSLMFVSLFHCCDWLIYFTSYLIIHGFCFYFPLNPAFMNV